MIEIMAKGELCTRSSQSRRVYRRTDRALLEEKGLAGRTLFVLAQNMRRLTGNLHGPG
jgi:hypothetical protein